MASNLRILIDYSTGENWEMPVWVYEKYQDELVKCKGVHQAKGMTFIQCWLVSLSEDERVQVEKK